MVVSVVLGVRVLRHGRRRRGEQIISAQLLHALLESISKLDRIEELHQGEELFDAILQGRAREQHLKLRVQRHALPEKERVVVLHLLALVDDQCLPLDGRKHREIAPQVVERGQQDVEAREGDLLPVRCLKVEVELQLLDELS